jgi:hypothetical protein
MGDTKFCKPDNYRTSNVKKKKRQYIIQLGVWRLLARSPCITSAHPMFSLVIAGVHKGTCAASTPLVGSTEAGKKKGYEGEEAKTSTKRFPRKKPRPV